jgi:hypothetical protein
MTLYTTDYLEYYLTLVAWVVNNGIWSILVASGVFALPFVAIVIQEWLQGPQRRCGRGQQGRAVVDAHREPGVGGDRGHHVRRHPVHSGGSRHDQVRHHALRAVPGQRPAAQRHGLVQRLHGAQQPERAGAGVVVLHARAVEGRDGLRWRRSPAARTCVRFAWTWMPRASTIRCWHRRSPTSRTTATARRAPSCSWTGRRSPTSR